MQLVAVGIGITSFRFQGCSKSKRRTSKRDTARRELGFAAARREYCRTLNVFTCTLSLIACSTACDCMRCFTFMLTTAFCFSDVLCPTFQTPASQYCGEALVEVDVGDASAGPTVLVSISE